MARFLTLCCSLIFMSVVLPASVEQVKTFGSYTVHYNAFTTDSLSPEIARLYNIKRSNNRALLNVSILQQVMGTSTKPVKAQVNVTATNMNLQLNQLSVREFIEAGEPGAIYYLAETTVNNGDMLTYNVSFTPDGQAQTYSFDFQQQFVTE